MDVRQLRYFLSIVEHGSISRAAAALHVAQPALSLHVKRLEETFGRQLLHRTSRGVVTTESGERLAQQARNLIDSLAALPDLVRGVEAAPAGPAVVGAPTSLGALVTPPLVKRLLTRCPDVRLRVVEALSGHMQSWASSGAVDLALIFAAQAPPGLTIEPLVRERLHLVGPLDEPLLSEGGAVPMDRALDLPLIMPSRPHGVREELERAATILRRAPNVIVEVDALEQIKTLVADGVGYTLLSQRYAAQGPLADRLRFAPVTAPMIERTIALAHAADRPLSAAARAVRTELLALFAEHTIAGRWRGEPPS